MTSPHARSRVRRQTSNGCDALQLAEAKKHTSTIELLKKIIVESKLSLERATKATVQSLATGKDVSANLRVDLDIAFHTAPYAPMHHSDEARGTLDSALRATYHALEEARRLRTARVPRPVSSGSRAPNRYSCRDFCCLTDERGTVVVISVA
jgi:hypothetical protein